MKVRDELGISADCYYSAPELKVVENITKGFKFNCPEGKVAVCRTRKCPDLSELWARIRASE